MSVRVGDEMSDTIESMRQMIEDARAAKVLAEGDLRRKGEQWAHDWLSEFVGRLVDGKALLVPVPDDKKGAFIEALQAAGCVCELGPNGGLDPDGGVGEMRTVYKVKLTQ